MDTPNQPGTPPWSATHAYIDQRAGYLSQRTHAPGDDRGPGARPHAYPVRAHHRIQPLAQALLAAHGVGGLHAGVHHPFLVVAGTPVDAADLEVRRGRLYRVL